MTTATSTPRRSRSAGAQRRGAAVGIDGQQRQFGPADVGAVDAGGGLDQPDPVLGDQGPALAGQHPHRLVVDQLAAQLIALLGILRRRHQPALAFGHHLAGDHHDVAVAQPGRGRASAAARSSPGRNSGSPVTGRISIARGGAVLELIAGRHAPQARVRRCTISAVAFGSVISSGIDAHRHARRCRPDRPRAPASNPASRCLAALRSAGPPPRRWIRRRSP